MFDGVIGKIISFWLFMLGVIFIAKMIGILDDGRTTVIYLIACALAFIVWTVARSMGRKRREGK